MTVTRQQIDEVADRILDTNAIGSKTNAVRQVLEAATEAGWKAPEDRAEQSTAAKIIKAGEAAGIEFVPGFEVYLLTDVAAGELLVAVEAAVQEDKRFAIGIDYDEDGTGHLKLKVGLSGQWSLPLETSRMRDWRP